MSRLCLIFSSIGFILLAGCSKSDKSPPSGAEGTSAAVPSESKRKPKKRTPVEEVKHLLDSGQPEKALALCRKTLASAKDNRQAHAALRRQCLLAVFLKSSRPPLTLKAMAPFNELIETAPKSRECQQAIHSLWRAFGQTLNRLDKAGDHETIETLWPTLTSIHVRPRGDSAVDQALKYRLRRWIDTGDVKHLDACCETALKWNRWAPVVHDLVREAQAHRRLKELLDAAQSRRARETVVLLALCGTQGGGGLDSVTRSAIHDAGANALLELIDEWKDALPANVDPMGLSQLAARFSSSKKKVEMLEMKLVLGTLAAEGVFRSRPKAAASMIRNLEQTARELWVERLERSKDPTDMASQEAMDLVRAEHPHPTREEIISALRQYVHDGRLVPPPLRELRERLPKINVAQGIRELRETYTVENGVVRLREVLRGPDAETFRDTIKDGVRSALEKAAKDEAFDHVERLAGFYVSEFAPGPDDSFRTRLKSLLESALTKVSEEGSERQRFFLLSLMADLFRGEATGDTAREEAVQAARDLARTLTPQSPRNSLKLPCSLRGMSVIRLENATQYHLLAFFDGPETFFVRLSPQRRGSVVLKNGEYETVVVVTKDDVKAYRGKRKYEGETSFDRFVVEVRETGKDSRTDGVHSTGAFTLLRTPLGVERATVAAEAEGKEEKRPKPTPLEKALADVDSTNMRDVRKAIDELSKHRRDERAYKALRDVALNLDDCNLRSFALEKLMPFRGHFDVKSVWIDRLTNDPERSVKSMALRQFTRSGLVDSARPLMAMAIDPDKRTRYNVIEELKTYHDRVPVEVAEELLLTIRDTDPTQGHTALRTLGYFKSPKGREAITNILKSKDPKGLNNFGFALYGWKDDPETLKILIRAIRQHKDPRIKDQLAKLLNTFTFPEAYAEMERLLKDERRGEESSTLLALLKTDRPPTPTIADAVLKIAAREKRRHVEEYAIRVLCKWRDPRVVPIIKACLAGKNQNLKDDLLRAMGDWRPAEVKRPD